MVKYLPEGTVAENIQGIPLFRVPDLYTGLRVSGVLPLRPEDESAIILDTIVDEPDVVSVIYHVETELVTTLSKFLISKQLRNFQPVTKMPIFTLSRPLNLEERSRILAAWERLSLPFNVGLIRGVTHDNLELGLEQITGVTSLMPSGLARKVEARTRVQLIPDADASEGFEQETGLRLDNVREGLPDIDSLSGERTPLVIEVEDAAAQQRLRDMAGYFKSSIKPEEDDN